MEPARLHRRLRPSPPSASFRPPPRTTCQPGRHTSPFPVYRRDRTDLQLKTEIHSLHHSAAHRRFWSSGTRVHA